MFFFLLLHIKILAFSGQNYQNQFVCLGRNILLARELTLFFFLQPSKFSRKAVQVYVYGLYLWIYSRVFRFSHKKVKNVEFTWIASALRLIYLHLLSLASSPETKHDFMLKLSEGNLCTISIECEDSYGAGSWGDNKWLYFAREHTNQLDVNLKMMKRNIHRSNIKW